MPIDFIPFDGWSPSASYIGEGWSTATNIYPSFGDWQPWPAFVSAATVAVAAPLLGRHVHTWTANLGAAFGPPFYSPNAITTFTGSRGSLYAVTTGGFTNLSRGGVATPYVTYGGGWRFASVGNDVWATNWIDPMQRRINNGGFFVDGVVSTFKPCPRFLVTVREHLVGANLSNAGRRQDEVVWSDADDATNFDPAATGSTSVSLAGSKPLASAPGMITGLVGGQYLLAFKETSIFYGEYSGPPGIFNFDTLSLKVGTSYPSSIINSRAGVFFLGSDGFYQIQGLSEPQKVSTPGIDQILLTSGFAAYPFDVANNHDAGEEDMQAVGFEVPGRSLIGWIMNLTWSTSGGSTLFLYDTSKQTWATVTLPVPASAMIGLPHSDSLAHQLVALLWTGTVAQYAPLSTSTVLAPTLGLNFRPISEGLNPNGQTRPARGAEMGQSQVVGVLPMFSKTSVAGTALTESVTVETMLDPHGGVTTLETRTSAERNAISGYYPFQATGQLARITINCAAENFANFEGVFIHTEPL